MGGRRGREVEEGLVGGVIGGVIGGVTGDKGGEGGREGYVCGEGVGGVGVGVGLFRDELSRHKQRNARRVRTDEFGATATRCRIERHLGGAGALGRGSLGGVHWVGEGGGGEGGGG